MSDVDVVPAYRFKIRAHSELGEHQPTEKGPFRDLTIANRFIARHVKRYEEIGCWITSIVIERCEMPRHQVIKTADKKLPVRYRVRWRPNPN